MHSKKIEILKFIQESGEITVLNVVKRFNPAEHRTTEAFLDSLVDDGYVRRKRGEQRPLDTLSLTVPSMELLEALAKSESDAAEQKAEQERAEAKRLQERAEDQSREERKQAAQNRFTIKITIASFFLGMIAEHFVQIISCIFSLFH